MWFGLALLLLFSSATSSHSEQNRHRHGHDSDRGDHLGLDDPVHVQRAMRQWLKRRMVKHREDVDQLYRSHVRDPRKKRSIGLGASVPADESNRLWLRQVVELPQCLECDDHIMDDRHDTVSAMTSFNFSGDVYLGFISNGPWTNSNIYRFDTDLETFQPHESLITHGAQGVACDLITDISTGSPTVLMAVTSNITNTAAGYYSPTVTVYGKAGPYLGFHRRQSIVNPNGQSATMFRYDDHLWLAVATYADPEKFEGHHKKFQYRSRIFRWEHGHFDVIYSIQTEGAVDIEHFEITGESYLAVANHRTFDTFCTLSFLYVLDSETDEYELFQNFHTCGASDFEHFEMGGHHYLAVANQFRDLRPIGYPHSSYIYRQYEIDSVIYWWAGSQFITWQFIPTLGITQWESLRLPNNEVILIAANSQGPLVLYQYDESGQFLPIPLEVALPTHVSVVRAMTIQHRFYLVPVSSRNNTWSNVFRLEFSSQREETAEEKILDEARKCVKRMSDWTEELQDRVDRLKDHFDNEVMTLTDDQTVTGNQEYEHVEVEHLVVKNLRIVRPPENSTGQNEGSSPWGHQGANTKFLSSRLDMFSLMSNLSKTTRRIRNIKRKMRDVVMMTGTGARKGPVFIRGKKTFTKDVNVLQDIVVEDVTTSGLVNGVDIVELDKSVVRRRGDQVIQGTVIIHGDVNVGGDVDVYGTTNNVSMDDLVLRDENISLTGDITFSGSPAMVVDGDIEVEGSINGLLIPEDLVLVYGDQVIAGSKTMAEDVTIGGNLEMARYMEIDGIDVSEFANQVVLLDGEQTIDASLVFEDLTIDGNLTTDGPVNGVDIDDLAANAVYKDSDQIIEGVKIFKGSAGKGYLLNITGDMLVEGKINGYYVPDDYITKETDQVIPASLTITGDMYVTEDIAMDGQLGWTKDGQVTWIDLSQDAVLLYGDQCITGHKTFTNSITVDGDLDMAEGVTINGVDVSELDKMSAKKNEATVIQDFVTFQTSVFATDVFLQSTLNDIVISEFAEQVFTKSGNQTISTPMTFKNLHLVDVDLSGLLDGEEVPGNLVTTATDQVITGSWLVEGDVEIGGDLVVAEGVTVGGVDYSEVDRTVVKIHGNQTITGPVRFAENVTFCDITLERRLNGLRIPEDLVLTYGDQTIRGRKIFQDDVFMEGDLHARDVRTRDRSINGVNVVRLARDAVMLEGDQNISGWKTFISDIEVQGDLTVEGLVNGVDLDKFAESVVTLSTDQVLEGDFTFKRDVKFLGDDVEITHTVNGVDLSEFAEQVIHTSDELITGTKTFSGDVVTMGHLDVDDVNGVDISELADTALYKNIPQTLTGHKVFLENFTCDNLDLVGDALIDGVDLYGALTLSGDHTVDGDMTFYSIVNVNSSLTVDGLIDGVDINELNDTAVWLEAGYQTIDGDKTFYDLTIEGDITVDGSVNEITDFGSFCQTLMTTRAKQRITGRIVFDGDVNMANLQVDRINGVDMHDFLHNTMLTSGSQTITAPQVVFSHPDGLAVEGDVHVEGDVVMKPGGTINSVDISELYEDMVHQGWHEDITGYKTFASDLVVQSDFTITGLINGINISNAVLRHTRQDIHTHVTFDGDLEVDGSIAVTGLVDGVDVSSLARRVVTLSTDQEISGNVRFKDLEVTGSLIVDHPVNGLKIPEDLVLVGESQTISGKKTFAGDVTMQKNLETRKLHGMSLDHLYSVVHKHFSRLAKSNTFTERVTFGGDTFIHGNVTLYGQVEGLDLSAIPPLPDFCNNSHSQLGSFSDQLQTLCPVVNELIDRTSDLPQHIGYFNILQNIQTPGVVKGAFFQPDPEADNWFIVLTPVPNADGDNNPCTASLGYMCGAGEPYCQPYPDLSLPTHNPSSIEFYTVHDMPYIIWLNTGSGTRACLDFLPPSTPHDEVSVIISPINDNPMVIPTKGAMDLVMFGTERGVYLVVANSYDEETQSSITPSVVFKMIREGDEVAFTWVQILPTVGAQAVDIVTVNNATYLCVANHHDSDADTGHLMSQVYVWDDVRQQFGLLQEFSTRYAVDCDLFEIKGRMYVAWAQHNPSEPPGIMEPIIIYRFDNFAGRFEDVILQQLQVPGAYDVEFFSAYGNWYLAIVVSDGRVRLFKWAGINAFAQDPFYLDLQGAQDVEVLTHRGEVFVLVPAYLSSDSGDNTADTILLKAYIEGTSGPGLNSHPCEVP